MPKMIEIAPVTIAVPCPLTKSSFSGVWSRLPLGEAPALLAGATVFCELSVVVSVVLSVVPVFWGFCPSLLTVTTRVARLGVRALVNAPAELRWPSLAEALVGGAVAFIKANIVIVERCARMK